MAKIHSKLMHFISIKLLITTDIVLDQEQFQRANVVFACLKKLCNTNVCRVNGFDHGVGSKGVN
jgi:hypothetical protein